MNRRFYPPCGVAVDQTTVGDSYKGHPALVTDGVDYALQSSLCPYYTSSNNQKTGDPGFDPDYYPKGTASGTETTANGKPVFFGRDLVFHDSNYLWDEDGTRTYAFASSAFQHNFGNGWDDEGVFPAKSSSNTFATIDTFCDQQGTKAQGSSTRAAICKKCLKEAGWYYDGVVLQDVNNKWYPSLWYTGNYLNFFPPKFLIAKKIVKDVIAVQSKVRMAIGHFAVSEPKEGLTIDKAFNPTCDQPANSNFDSNRGAYVSAVDSLEFAEGTPLAEALFDVGRYYHSPDLTWFGTSDTGEPESASNKNSFAICYSCQTSSVIVLTDGEPTSGDGNSLPSGATTLADTNGKYAGNTNTGIRGITSSVCPQCDKFSGTKEYMDNLAKTAWYLHNMDLRDNSEVTRDCQTNGGKQVMNTYTVGFGTSQLPDANTILSATAEAGGGVFIGAENAQVLKEGIATILENINTRDTSFSVATVSTLQTTSGRAVIVPRFEPSKTAHYRGHLSRFDLYSEFVNDCDPKSDGSGTGDLDCDGYCTGVFLQDKPAVAGGTGDFVVEDSAGNFVKTDPSSKPTCTQAPKCSTAPGKSCSVVSSTAATPWWDAGELLAGTTSSQKWKSRTVWTVVDSDVNGKIDADDTVTQLQATDTVADAIIPYLALGGGTVCNQLASALTAKNPARAAEVTASQRECAKTIIRYVLGADIFNSQNKTSGYPATTEDDLWDRDWLLGDIFHSSPLLVDPPGSRTGLICPNGLSNQCLESLWKTPTPGGEAGYDGYAQSSTYKNRPKIVLVGANDGLLHAFNAGTWHGGDDDTYTTGVDESKDPFNGYYDRGNGSELWAFLPPDMIAKIPLYVSSSAHQFFVDGTPMVRDVWVDGTENGLAAASSADDMKQKQEFHTVAVMGERRGGTHFFALDVTAATGPASQPKFLWIYPQPNSAESLDFGETYGDYLPRPPPIGPVRLKAGAGTAAANTNTPTMDDGSGVRYHERWVVFLNGGFDPQYVRGRGVHMVDVWTGAEIFDFSYSSDTTTIQNALRFPVPATVGMVGWGPTAKRDSGGEINNNYFFDTATFGDAGGQMWVLRFHAPGTLNGDGLATNWVGARAFQMGTQTQDCKLCAGQPFFYMTANIPLPANGAYRVYAGAGDRFNLLDTKGGTCGPDNIRACVLRGCTVTVDKTSNVLESFELASAARGLSQTACGAMTNDETTGTIAACAANGKAKIVISNCPSPASNNGSTGTTKDTQASCVQETDGYRCTRTAANEGSKLALSDTNNGITLGNMYYSLLVFEDSGNRGIFETAPGASAYDGARLYLNETGLNASYALTGSWSPGLVPIAASDTTPTLATADSKGWVLYYNNGPTTTADNHTYNVYWADERTSSGTSTLGRDIFWNTIQPATGEVTSSNGNCDTSRCGTTQARRIAGKYGANVETGGLPQRLFDPTSGQPVRSLRSALLVPTQADQPTVFVNQKGQIAVGLTAVNPERGATNVGQTDAIDPSQDYGVMEVSKTQHACRHAASDAAAVCK
jgi:type IV pilus assembly protein PilY1